MKKLIIKMIDLHDATDYIYTKKQFLIMLLSALALGFVVNVAQAQHMEYKTLGEIRAQIYPRPLQSPKDPKFWTPTKVQAFKLINKARSVMQVQGVGYKKGVFECNHFTSYITSLIQLISSREFSNLSAPPAVFGVTLNNYPAKGKSHSVLVFLTIEGPVYCEPQNGRIFTEEIIKGKDIAWHCN